MLPSLFQRAEVCRLVGIGKSQLYRLIAVGDFPAPVKIRRSSRWLSSEVHAWIHKQASLRASEPMETDTGARQEAHLHAAAGCEEVLK